MRISQRSHPVSRCRSLPAWYHKFHCKSNFSLDFFYAPSSDFRAWKWARWQEKLGWKEKCVNSRLLATIRPSANLSLSFVYRNPGKPLQIGPFTEAAGGKKSARGAVALLLPAIARRGHRHPEMRPKTSPGKGKSTVLRATHIPAKTRKGGSQGKVQGACEMLKPPAVRSRQPALFGL